MEQARKALRGIAYAALIYVIFVGSIILREGATRLIDTDDMFGGAIWTAVGIVLILFCGRPLGRAALRAWRRHRQMQEESVAAYFRRQINEDQ